ncbi:GDYXXLXY domain-containing protein [Paenibacillus sp. SI8]|uniref:GDYXXLXY domain-containing protein n=1 Tax=unclassified Paenibacillus TaxID=185978 RepID=UPI003465EB9E
MNAKYVTISLGYVLGVSALLTAIVYFFATNWEALSRAEKLTPVFMLIVGFYWTSIWLSQKSGRALLSRLALFACCISFGVGIALIGQTYNSHADSYSLFAVWSIPALLFALLTRWQPFYILTYITGHLAYCFYFFPKWWGSSETELVEITIVVFLAVLNGCLYVLAERGRVHAPFLKWLSFQATIALMLWVSNSFVFEAHGILLNIPFAAVLAAAIYYTHRTKNKSYLLFAGLWVSVAVIMKYIEIAVHVHNELFFIGGILFVIVFIGANVKFVHYIRTWNSSAEFDSSTSAAVKREGDFTKWLVRVLTLSVIVIGTILGSLSLIGFVTLVLGVNNPEYALIGFGLIAVIAMIFWKQITSLVRFTLMGCGFLLGAGAAAVTNETFMLLLFFMLVVLSFLLVNGNVQRIVFFLVGESIAGILLYDWLDSEVLVFLLLSVVLLLIFASNRWVGRDAVRKPLLYSSFPSFLFTFFVLTFITESTWYYVSNALFFLVIVLAMFISRQQEVTWLYRWGLAYWIAFLVYKYYDLAWKLLHKSISFAIIGAVIIAMTIWYEKHNRQTFAEQPREFTGDAKLNRLLIAVLVFLQISTMGLQIGKSEWLLANGQLIKLELVPLDPRSMMQGDYVRLRYAISEPELPAELQQSSFFNKKISLVLALNVTTGVYEYRRIYANGDKLSAGEVRLNGTISGFQTIEFGIETYFIPEGTGHAYEQNAKFAEVRVSASGDAILVQLLPRTSLVR